MQFKVGRETLLKPLQQVVSVVERRQTLPVLANLLVVCEDNRITLTGTDLEVELQASCAAQVPVAGSITLPARKWFDIVRALPDGVTIELKMREDRAQLVAGRSRYTLATLPADDFPSVDDVEVVSEVSIEQAALKRLIERTAFAMAQQDVRFYLNGLLFEIDDSLLRCVATDGHRLALSEATVGGGSSTRKQIILPRKGVLELQRLLGGDTPLTIQIGRNHLRVDFGDARFTSKLIDGRFPEYDAVIPIGADKTAAMDRELLKTTLQRAAILSNEKYRGVRLEFEPSLLRIVAHNPEQEEAVEEIEVDTRIDDLKIGFNVTYLLEALNALEGERVELQMRDSGSSALVVAVGDEASRHVVMPLRL